MTMERPTEVEHLGGRDRKRRSRWFTGKFLLLSLSGATLLAAGATLVVPQFQDKASAASNGQMLNFCGMPGSVRHVTLFGTNQDNQPAEATFTFGAPTRDGCQRLGGWWWKGQVSIDWHADLEGTQVIKQTECFVPEGNLTSDFTTCNF